jgi:general secretion pathway protein A
MRDGYLSHFGLREPPFSKEVPDVELWLPSSKQGIVDELCDVVESRSSAVLVGDPGVGKTCVLRALRKRLPDAGFRLTYCHNVTLGRRDFYRQLCVALGLSPSAMAAAVFHAVSSHVHDLGRDRIHPVFLLDEAHLLHQDTLDHLHILLNYEWDSRALLSLLLVGLFSRMHRRLRMDPLTPADTAEYIRMRLARVGCDRELLASDAVAMIHEASLGGMRDTDRIATAALREAVRKKRKLVERDAVARVIDIQINGDTGA